MKNIRPCQAKDPSACSYHAMQQAEPKAFDASDSFDNFMAKNDKLKELEAQIRWTRKMFEILANNRSTEIETSLKGLSDYSDESVDKLQKYNDSYAQLSKNLNEEQLAALKDYTGISYENVNLLLRDEERFVEESKPEYAKARLERAQKTIKILDSIFASASDQNKTVYRYITPDTTKPFTSSEVYAKNLGFIEGKEITFASYLSTTIDPDLLSRYAEEDKEENATVIFVIKTSKGIPVGRTATNSSEHTYTQTAEREILLPRGMKFKVTKVSRTTGYPIGIVQISGKLTR